MDTLWRIAVVLVLWVLLAVAAFAVRRRYDEEDYDKSWWDE